MGDSSIEWTDKTWNPVRGCARVSEGCRNCYAERFAARFAGKGRPYDGLVKLGGKSGPRWTGVARFVPEHLADPMRWRKSARVFVNSMSDLFHDDVTNEQIAAVFGVMAATPRHTYQILTKRPARMVEWFRWVDDGAARNRESPSEFLLRAANTYLTLNPKGASWWTLPVRRAVAESAWPLPSVWLGVSVENQAAADERIPLLLQTPAAVRFLSCEPLLGPVALAGTRCSGCGYTANDDARHLDHHLCREPSARLDWVIAGCESGPGARPCGVEWLRSLRDQCAADGVPFFLKQAVAVEESDAIKAGRIVEALIGGSGVRTGPGSHFKKGGVIGAPYLDGRQHLDFPEAP